MRPSILLMLVLAGCTTVADLRAQPPFIETASKKSVQQFSACLAEQWAERSGATSTSPRANGLALTLTYTVYSSQMVAANVDVDDLGSSRSVTVYARKGDASDKLRGEVEACV